MKLLDQNDETFRPIPDGGWNTIWDNAGETREALGLCIIRTVIKTKWMQLMVDKYRAEEAAEYDACNANYSRQRDIL
jgi:hypothetical protein